MVQMEMPFKGISYLELWQAFVQQSVSICAISVKNIMRNNFGEINLNLGQWFRSRCHLKDFLSVALDALLFSGVKTHYAILKEGIMGNNHVK